MPEALEKVIPVPRSLHPHLEWWLDESNVLQGQPLHPLKRALQIFTDTSKEGWGSPWRTYHKRFLVGTRKQTPHKLSGVKGSLSSPKGVPTSLYGQNCPGGHGQYNSSSLHQQGGGHEIRPTLCPSMENLDLVYQPPNNAKSPAHPRPSKCDSRQAIQTGSDHPNRVVPPSGSFSTNMQPMAPASNRSFATRFNHKLPQFVSSTGLPGCSSGCTYSAMGRSGCIRLPNDRHIGQSGGEATGLPVQETHSDCPGVAQHALVLGPSDHVQSGPSQPAQPAQAAHTTLQSDPSQKSDKSKSPCLAPRATKIKEQGFSETVAARTEAPQRRSTRSVYEAKWAIFTKWCITNQVDFRSPPVKSVADFLMYLFEDKKLQPSTIDGYRSTGYRLAKEGPGSVAPVVIPALAPTLDKSLKSDRSLCPVRALRCYLDRTSDLRQHKELVFVSFKKGFDKDISPATISSWIKQTVILCYELSDHQAHTLHQVKAHDVRAFAAFQSGVSLDQILAACHWKSHNTFTQFYLKDVAWADSELFHLGPVVAAQQIHQ